MKCISMSASLIEHVTKKTWDLSRVITFDKDKKFLSEFWKITFHHLKIKLFYITTYHFSVDDQSERTNQKVELVMRLALMKDDVTNFTILLSLIQAMMNNSVNSSIEIFFNEIIYEFKITKFVDLFFIEDARIRVNDKNSSITIEKKRNLLKKKMKEVIALIQVMQKIKYDSRHTSMN